MPSICRDRTARFGGSPMAMHRPNGDAPTEWGCTDRMGMHRRAIRGAGQQLDDGIARVKMTDRSLGQQDLQPLTDEGEQAVVVRHLLQVGGVAEGSQILRQIPLLKHVQSGLLQTVSIVH